MAARPTPEPSLAEYLGQVAKYAVLGWILVLALVSWGRILFSIPTAAIVRLLLSSAGYVVSGSPAHIKVGDLPMRFLYPWWTAAPVFVLGAAAVLAYPTDRAHKVAGVIQIWFHTTMINAMMLGWVAAQPDRIGMDLEVSLGTQLTTYDLFVNQMRIVYPPAMAIVLCLSLLFWMARVAPRPLQWSSKSG
jgi:hypothetical protein